MDNYENFMTEKEKFKLEMETYIPEFLQRMENDTLKEPVFMQRSVEMMELAESVGINLQQYIFDYATSNGLV